MTSGVYEEVERSGTRSFARSTRTHGRRRKRHDDLRVALVFLSPWIIGFLLFQLYPLLASAYYSLTAYNIARSPIFVGFSNFVDLFTNDALFRLALEHSLIFAAVSVPLNLTIAFLIALLLNRDIKGRALLRAAFFLPAIVPAVANAMLWAMLLRQRGGLVDQALGLVHLPAIDWLYSPQWALPALILINAWAIGPAVVIFLAGLQDVPRQLYEAAKVDGAKSRHVVRYVTLPMTSRVVVFNLIIGIITAFQVFTLPYVLFSFTGTSGGPENGGLLYSVQLFTVAFAQFDFGYAAAMAWVLTAIIFVLALFSIRFARKYATSSY
jgi:multiple sugar transport system permease protein